LTLHPTILFLLDTSMYSKYSLVAGQIMGKHVVFVRPVDSVGAVYDLLNTFSYTSFPVIDTGDGDILYGTIGRNQLIILLKKRAFGRPVETTNSSSLHDSISFDSSYHSSGMHCNYIEAQPNQQRFMPLVQWEVIQKVSCYCFDSSLIIECFNSC